MGEKRAKFKAFFYREALLFLIIITVIIFAAILRTCVIQAFYVPSASMIPTLRPWDRVLTNKIFNCRIIKPKRGDIIVFKAPDNPENLVYTKRVIAKPGEEVKVRKGIVYINDEPLEEPYTQGIPEDYGPLKVSEGTLFVLGDHRDYSEVLSCAFFIRGFYADFCNF